MTFLDHIYIILS